MLVSRRSTDDSIRDHKRAHLVVYYCCVMWHLIYRSFIVDVGSNKSRISWRHYYINAVRRAICPGCQMAIALTYCRPIRTSMQHALQLLSCGSGQLGRGALAGGPMDRCDWAVMYTGLRPVYSIDSVAAA